MEAVTWRRAPDAPPWDDYAVGAALEQSGSPAGIRSGAGRTPGARGAATLAL